MPLIIYLLFGAGAGWKLSEPIQCGQMLGSSYGGAWEKRGGCLHCKAVDGSYFHWASCITSDDNKATRECAACNERYAHQHDCKSEKWKR